jgi:hypothetical protein
MSETEPIVGRSYTRARKFPLVIGRLPQGGRIIGGPYTIAQVAVMVTVIIALRILAPIWAHLGYGDVAVYAALPYAAGFAVRKARIEGRDPLRAGVGALNALGSPAAGRMRGRTFRLPALDLTGRSAFTIDEDEGE